MWHHLSKKSSLLNLVVFLIIILVTPTFATTIPQPQKDSLIISAVPLNRDSKNIFQLLDLKVLGFYNITVQNPPSPPKSSLLIDLYLVHYPSKLLSSKITPLSSWQKTISLEPPQKTTSFKILITGKVDTLNKSLSLGLSMETKDGFSKAEDLVIPLPKSWDNKQFATNNHFFSGYRLYNYAEPVILADFICGQKALPLYTFEELLADKKYTLFSRIPSSGNLYLLIGTFQLVK